MGFSGALYRLVLDIKNVLVVDQGFPYPEGRWFDTDMGVLLRCWGLKAQECWWLLLIRACTFFSSEVCCHCCCLLLAGGSYSSLNWCQVFLDVFRKTGTFQRAQA